MYVLFFLHLTSPGARWHLCQKRERTGASKRLTAPWALVRGPHPAQGLLRKLAAPVREAVALALPAPLGRAAEGFLLRGRCWTVYRDQSTGVIFRRGDLIQCTGREGVRSRHCPATHGHSKDLQRHPPPTPHSGNQPFNQLVRESRPPGSTGHGCGQPPGGRCWHSAHTPAAQGAGSPCPSPLNALVFLCVLVTSERNTLDAVVPGTASSCPDSGK